MESNLKITIDQLKNYLGTGLRIKLWEIPSSYETELIPGLLSSIPKGAEITNIKPICYRLSDLDKFIPELGFVPIEEIIKYGNWCDAYDEYFKIGFCGDDLIQAPFELVQKFVEWHFWVFGEEYFEKGLVIDKLKETSHE